MVGRENSREAETGPGLQARGAGAGGAGEEEQEIAHRVFRVQRKSGHLGQEPCQLPQGDLVKSWHLPHKVS